MLDELRTCACQDFSFFYPERSVGLHSLLINCGYNLYTGGYEWDGLKRGSKTMVIWQYTISGRGRLRLGTEYYDMAPGTAFMIEVPGDHCYFLPEDSEHWELCYVSVQGAELVRLFRELTAMRGVVNDYADTSAALAVFMEIFQLARKGRLANVFEASALAYDFMMALYRDLMSGGGGGIPDFVREVIGYCMKHLAEPIGVDEMAECAGLSRYHFSREFKRHTGFSPQAYLNELRIRKAVRMLQSERKNVKEIAADCGFDDLSYFSKVFRKACGVSPANFRLVGK